MGEGGHDEEPGQADRAEATRSAGIAPIGERMEERNGAPRENDDVEDEQEPEDRRGDDPGEEHRRPIGVGDQPRGERDDEGRDEEDDGRPEASVERLAEARDERRGGRGEEAAPIGGTAVGPDPARLARPDGPALERRPVDGSGVDGTPDAGRGR